ncbi:MAG: hypothetical protein OEY10_00075 [Nitrosopumilus sp.]|nr:hypothetical protein [Nitrosopumilus sp.]
MSKAITVKELIAQLSELDEDMEVWAEGCGQCVNRIIAVTVTEEKEPCVWLEIHD